MIDRPDLCVIVNARDVLISRDFIDRERSGIAEKLPSGRQILPERHLYRLSARLGSDAVELRRCLNNSALPELCQFRRALDCIFFELCGDDNVRHTRFCHKLNLRL